MAEYDSSIALAQRLIKKKGQLVKLRRITDGTPSDPAMPWRPGTPNNNDQDVYAVWLEYQQNQVDGTVVHMGDQQVLMPALNSKGEPLTTNPNLKDVLLRGTEEWEIIRVMPLKPGAQDVIFDMQVRQ